MNSFSVFYLFCNFVCVMMLFQSPIIWLLRIRNRKGYGVHSPFAFDLVTNVLYNKEKYYAYEQMDRDLKWWERVRVRSMRHLAFRLANYHAPRTLYCKGLDQPLWDACMYGRKSMKMLPPGSTDRADMVFVTGADEEAMRHVGEGTMLLVKDINKCRKFWNRIKDDARVTVTFDLYDVGIAFARMDLKKQHYKINW